MKQLFLFFLVMIVSFTFATSEGEPLPELTFQSEIFAPSLAEGNTFKVALTIDIPKEYHLYGNPLGPGLGKPLQVTISPVDGVEWQKTTIDTPSKYIPQGMEELWTWSYDEKVQLYFTGLVTGNVPANAKVTIIIDGLVCKTACIPVYGEHLFTLRTENNPLAASKAVQDISFIVGKSKDTAGDTEPVGSLLAGGGLTPTEDSATQKNEALSAGEKQSTVNEKKGDLSVTLALFFAFIAGVILNFMPCVLPVLGIKILSFSKGREGSKMQSVLHSIAFAVGMILVFLILATLAAFLGMSWGEQFQNPVFMIAVISMIFVFALGMFDLFMILVPTKVSEMEMKSSKDGLWGNFLKGVFATILATPCSGPLLGATLAWTLSQPTVVIYLVFFFLGLGMASPYILLASSDRLSKLIPKPGAWMDDFKHFLGFFLFAFAVYLLSTLKADLVVPTVGLQVVLAFGVILYTRVSPFGSSWKRKIMTGLVVLSIIIGGIHLNYNVLFGIKKTLWHEFTEEGFEKALAQKEDIIIDFTAKWCLNCQTNKAAVYETDKMKMVIRDKKLYAIRGDLTNENKSLEELRTKLGSRSIPFLVLIPKGDTSKAVRLRDVVTPGQVYGAMEGLYGPLKE